MKDSVRKSMLTTIQLNIAKFGCHIYLVSGNGPNPRYAYTIGVSQIIGAELILAGASFYSAEDVFQIINEIAAKLSIQRSWYQLSFEVGSLGVFSLHEADSTWTTNLMLGALDFYNTKEIPALQIVPKQEYWTIDIPDLTKSWSAVAEPVWQWLSKPWKYQVSEKSIAVTNLEALRGERITEAVRWEEDNWELFAGAGPDVPQADIRPIPLGTLLAIDQSLISVLNLEIGQGLWRDSSELGWHPWM